MLALAGLVAATGAPRTGAAAEPVSPASHQAVQQLADEVRGRGWLGYAARSERGDWDLFVCRPDGSARRPLTTTPAFNEFAPQFSRDGRRLLYRRLPRAEAIDGNRYGAQGELILSQSDGSAPRLLGVGEPWAWASWSPDGQQIACLSLPGVLIYDLATLRAVRRFERKGFFQQVTWSPDGQWFVGVANSYGTGWSVARLNTATGEASAVHRVDCCTPDWFPDSRHIVFSWRPPGQPGNGGQGWTQLWMTDAEAATPRLIYGEDGRHVYGGQVAPDGRYVLFTGNLREDGDPANAGAPMALMRLSDAPIIGGASRELRALHPGANHGPVLPLPVGWEPCWTMGDLGTGSPTAASREASHSPTGAEAIRGVVVGQAHASAQDELSSLARELHDRGWLVFSAKTDRGDWDLFRMRPDGSDRRTVTDTPAFNEAGARFSPDGARLLYYRMPKSVAVDNNTYGTFELVVANAEGTAPVAWGREFPWATWGPDGTRLACLAPKGIRIVDVATRSVEREFPRKGIVSQLVWSPDGTRLAGTANGLGSFWNIGCLNLDTGAIEAVSETDRYNCTPDWTPDSRRIVYARGIIPEQPGRAELWVAGADGTARRRLYAEAGQHIYGACASPDGAYVAFTRSVEDLGQVPAIEMAIVRWPKNGDTHSGPVTRLDLGPGWEPHWTAKATLK